MTVEVELRAARVRYGPLEALHGVDLAFPAARVSVLIGRNGAGRTTTLRALVGAVPLSAGTCRWQGRDVTDLPAYRRARLGLAFVPAEHAIFGSLTVAENLGPRARTAPEVADTFPELLPLLDRRAETLSGGQQQLVALCRALLRRPRLLLLDEPDRGLAPAVVARLHRRLLELAAADGRTVILAAQALPPTLTAAGVVHVLHRGRVAFSGEPGELRLSE
ncbi:ATP-binding cassette domain-containing protein [Catenulispora sp. NL8]|uniref:ATP-binding cassette domain-containing protein n=1 Tax=Catenulispora pinistramenti TaxID=2705254 RepID=A0ABS5L6Q5_9ACTN|nr:ATP-binding cassette domain-containing protein [Catenulispora pinistramenti]MBS2554030.1 ATP-binding cassette domain-containing protein [Catenulispora pinistramenti]